MRKQNRMANSVDSDETARYEPSHLEVHCLHRYLYQSAGLKRLRTSPVIKDETILLGDLFIQNAYDIQGDVRINAIPTSIFLSSLS